MDSNPTHHLGHVPLPCKQPAQSSMAMLGPRDGSWGAHDGPGIQEYELKTFFFFLLVGWGLRPGPLEIEFQSLGLEASGEPMDSRNQGAAGFREYQATEDSVQRNLMRRC